MKMIRRKPSEERKEGANNSQNLFPGALKCCCCGKIMTAHEASGSQGWHCAECWKNLDWDEEGWWCNLHFKERRHIKVWPLFDPLLNLDDLEGSMRFR